MIVETNRVSYGIAMPQLQLGNGNFWKRIMRTMKSLSFYPTCKLTS